MKQILVLTFVFIVVQSVNAQFTIRNDFVINGKEHKIKNRGITSIAINLDHHPNLNYLVNGKGGKTLYIDVDALRYPDKQYTYTEIAEKVYVPNVTTGIVRTVPVFLLLAPRQQSYSFFKLENVFKPVLNIAHHFDNGKAF